MHAVTIGLDIAKSLFQVQGVDCRGDVVIRRQLKRRQVRPFFKKLPPYLIGIEACAPSHHWSRESQGAAVLASTGICDPEPELLGLCGSPARARAFE